MLEMQVQATVLAMTYLIPESSTKRGRAERFGLELERAMKRRGMGSRAVAAQVGSSRTSVMYWRTGRILPRTSTVRRLADVVDWPRLVSLAMELRRRQCDTCSVDFIDESGSDNRRFCTPECQRVAEKRRMGSTTDARAVRAERRLLAHRRAVAAFCRACEPEGLCRDVECPLRPVSPLALA